MSSWIPVKDALPILESQKDLRVRVLAVWDYQGIVEQMSFIPSDNGIHRWMFADGRRSMSGPTHWMPMPKYPA